MKGPTAVKEIMKAQLFQDDTKFGPTPTRLLGYAKKFSQIQRERERDYKKTLSRGDKYDLKEYQYDPKKSAPTGDSRNPRYKGTNYKPWKDKSLAKKEEEATPRATSGGEEAHRNHVAYCATMTRLGRGIESATPRAKAAYTQLILI